MKQFLILLFGLLLNVFGFFAQDVSLNGPTACNGAATTGTWTVPCGVTSIIVEVYGGGGGAGGGGGGSNGGLFNTRGGGGGGGGGYTSITLNVTPGSVFNYSIGAGGCGGGNGGDGSSGGNGTNGGNTTFTGSDAGGGNINLVANGGVRGNGGSGTNGSTGSGGAGGTASGGTTNTTGGAGSNGSGGTGGSGGNGAGPSGGAGGATTAAAGTAIGGGGAGGGNSAGGRGAAGGIRITYNSTVTLPDTPLISSTSATCLTAGSSTISNFDASANYIFTPTGPTVVAGGAISGMTVGTSYTVVASVAGCESLASAAFSNSGVSSPPANPTISNQPPTCTSAGTCSISNFNAAYTYQFSPAGPTVDASGNILDMQIGTNYTVIADDGSCTSQASNSFSINAALTLPNSPTIASVSATCLTPGSSSISNFNSNHTYIFSPSGPTVGASGAISGMTLDTDYTVIANDGTCDSQPSNVFSNVSVAPPPPAPTFTIVPPTCTADGGAVISNYLASNTYTFTPAGPTVGMGGVITGLSPNTSYTAISNDGSCSSSPSTALTVQSQLPAPTPSISGILVHCPGVNTTLTASGGVSYQWLNAGGATIGSNASIQAQQGTYSVIATDGNGCVGNTSATVTAHPQPNAPALSATELICLGDEVTFSSNIPSGAQIFWEGPNAFESSQASFSLVSSTAVLGIYTARIVDANGCISPESNLVLTVTENYSFDDFVLPNVITVNNDNVNETLDLDSFLKTCDDYTITYFNRWGNLIMTHGRGGTPFSGKTSSGTALPDGVYFYKLQYYSGGQQKNVEKTGFVHVLK